jgi:predicted ATP-dependent Lon-type protease
MELDAIDKLAAKAFEGYIVRKDLVRKFKGQYPVPTYVAEFLLGRYCSSTDEKEIEEGLQVVQRQLADRTVRPGEEEYFKSKARETGSIRIIDIITARLDAKTDSYVAELPSLRLRDVRITPALVQQHDRMLTGGFYAEIELVYDATIAEEQSGRPFGVESIRADGGIVMVGNFDVDVQHQQKVGHLFGPLPPEMRDDTAFQDRIHCYAPGWDVPKMSAQLFTNRFGLVSDFLSECWTHLRKQSRLTALQGRVFFGGALSGRDTWATQRTVNGLLKLLYPNPDAPIPDDALDSATRWARTAWRSSWSRRSFRARTASAPIRCRPAKSGRSVRVGWTRTPGFTGSKSRRDQGLA